ncbi:MAG TPA: MFS transporter [Opitutaceae bacterium]|nr:MFS transporter [Opitutaceae bacterium]
MHPPASGTPAAPRPAPHPLVYTVLIAPFGATLGFVSVALAFLATRDGLTVQQGAELIATGMLPNVWKFFWSPIGDTTLSRKRWYLLSCAVSAAGMFAMAAVPLGPATLRLMQAVILVTAVAATFLGFAVEAMVAHLTPPADRGRVSGWFQAGNLGGTGIGGGLGLWLLINLPRGWQAGLVLAALTLACAAVLPWLPEVPAESRGTSLPRAMRNVAADLWQVARSRDGVLSAVLCFVPVGTGAAQGVLAQSVVAAHWGAGAGAVELVQGVLNGVVSMAGCLLGGYGCRFFGPRAAYAVFGALMAAVTFAMAFAPATPAVYVVGNLGYAVVTGFCYAAFSAFVLDAIGAGNAATKYNGYASLSNFPIWYMGLALAAAETRLGPKGMLLTESACGVLGIAVFAAAAAAWRARPVLGVPAAVPVAD